MPKDSSFRYAKRLQKYRAPADWNFRNNPLVGTEWQVQGSKEVYTVTLTDRGFTCECVGFTMHGKCKHTTEILNRFEEDMGAEYT